MCLNKQVNFFYSEITMKYIVILVDDGLIYELKDYEFSTTIPILLGSYCEVISPKNQAYEDECDLSIERIVLKDQQYYSYIFYPNKSNTIEFKFLTCYEIKSFTKPILFIKSTFTNLCQDVLNLCMMLENFLSTL